MDKNKLIRDYESNPLKRGEMPELQDVIYVYIELNYTIKETVAIFKCSDKGFRKFLHDNNIVKSREDQIRSTKEMWLRKYGVENVAQLDSVITKRKNTCEEKYGHCCALHGEGVKEKVQQTFQERYNDTTAARDPNVRRKTAETCQKRYGKNSTFEVPEIRQQIRDTLMERHGVTNAAHVPGAQQKKHETNLKKYGVPNASQNEQIKKKVKDTWDKKTKQEKTEINKKREQTCLQLYGETNAAKSQEIKHKTKQNNLMKYGVVAPIQLESIKDKRRQNNTERWGTSNISTSHIPLETLNIISNKDKLSTYISTHNITTVYELACSLNISYSGIQKRLHKFNLWNLLDHYTSVYETELQSLFPMFVKTRKVIPPYELDLYNDELKFAIEFNGNYWHSTINKTLDYHQKKSLTAESNNVFVYHIFEYEWTNERTSDIIISQINNKLGRNEKIGARKCQLREIDYTQCSEFLNENHIQGKDQSSIRYGLFYNNMLVAVMTFCKPRFNKEYEWELSRFCCKCGYNIVGGASKLFKHFLTNFDGSIISYSNVAKTTGNLYKTLGFTFSHLTKPSYVWTNGEETLSRYQCQKHKLTKWNHLGNTEIEIMTNRGFMQVFDCGTKVWEIIR